MGETMARIVANPLATTCKSFNETCLDSFEMDSGCSDCWSFHLVTHPSARRDDELLVEEKEPCP